MNKLAFVFLLTAVMSVCARGENIQVTPVDAAPLEPATLEDKIDRAQLIVLGKVVSIAPAEPGEGAMGKMTRVTYEAEVDVETLYEGVAGDSAIKVRFLKSDQSTRPQLLELAAGERAVLFLQPGAGAFYEFITPFTGKETPSYDLLKTLDDMASESDMKATLVATMQLETASATAGEPVYVAVRMDNTGGLPLLLPSTPNPAAALVVTGPDDAALRPAAVDSNAARFPLYLPPNAVYGFHADLAQYFDLSMPGAYTVTLRYAPPPSSTIAAWTGIVQSKTFGFTIY